MIQLQGQYILHKVQLVTNEFKLNQLLAASKTKEVRFIRRVEDFDKIEYDITKEKA